MSLLLTAQMRRRGGFVRPPVEFTRDALLQPFSNASVWNTPIGTASDLVSAGLGTTSLAQGRITTDPIEVCMNPSAPVKALTSGTRVKLVNKGPAPNQVPAGVRVHIEDATTHDSMMNGITAVLEEGSTRYFWTGQPLDRETVADNPKLWYLPFTSFGVRGRDDLYGVGLRAGHGGADMSGLGGCIRAWEWFGTAPIQHALAVNLYGIKYLSGANLSQGGTSGPGWRWPARVADGDYADSSTVNYYGRNTGQFDFMGMGTLLTLPDSFNIAALTDSRARRIASAFYGFGGYVVDNTARDVHALSVESTADASFTGAGTTFHAELMGVFRALCAVTNQNPSNVGGPGPRRVAAPPDLVLP